YVEAGSATVTYTTIAFNAAGAGLYQVNGTVSILGSIVADNARNCTLSGGTFTDGGSNVADANDPNQSCGAGFTYAGPKLGAPAGNGGWAQTDALAAGRAALDRIASGTNGCGTTVTTDQRGSGYARPQTAGGSCDAGAYELQEEPTATATSNPTVTA